MCLSSESFFPNILIYIAKKRVQIRTFPSTSGNSEYRFIDELKKFWRTFFLYLGYFSILQNILQFYSWIIIRINLWYHDFLFKYLHHKLSVFQSFINDQYFKEISRYRIRSTRLINNCTNSRWFGIYLQNTVLHFLYYSVKNIHVILRR